jgi:hypothetical protein
VRNSEKLRKKPLLQLEFIALSSAHDHDLQLRAKQKAAMR